jgi:hypothetical protein
MPDNRLTDASTSCAVEKLGQSGRCAGAGTRHWLVVIETRS